MVREKSDKSLTKLALKLWPRWSVQVRTTLAAVGLVVASAGLCGYFVTLMAERALLETLKRDTLQLAETTSLGLRDHLGEDREDRLNAMVSGVALDRRVALVSITDAEGRVLARQINRPQAWRTYLENYEPGGMATSQLHRVHRLREPDGSDLMIVQYSIWSPVPAASGKIDPAAASGIPVGEDVIPQSGTFIGHLLLAMSDPDAQQMTSMVRATALAVVCAVCLLCLPMAVWTGRSLARPLKLMMQQTQRLAAGVSTRPMMVRRSDEVGMLAESFNAMTRQLNLARAEILAANRDLEAQVAQRTQQLSQANQQLQQQMEEKDEFIRAVTHDLGAPLRNITGITKMLLAKYSQQWTDEAIDKLQRIAANARTETEFLGDLLELSRLRARSGKSQVVNLMEVVTGVRESLEWDLGERRIQLSIDTTFPTVRADRNRIRQVFQNLVDNAVKYMPADQPVRQVHVGCRSDKPGVAGHVFYVSDTGRGIDPKDHQRIFQVFQRARYSGQSQESGRGVGLASVKTIVETYGGRIWVESQPEQGATFYFTLGSACYDPTDKTAFEVLQNPAPVNPMPNSVDAH